MNWWPKDQKHWFKFDILLMTSSVGHVDSRRPIVP
jgi:hypothetical protein